MDGALRWLCKPSRMPILLLKWQDRYTDNVQETFCI